MRVLIPNAMRLSPRQPRPWIAWMQFGEFFHQLAAAFILGCRHHHLNFNELVAALDTLAAQPQAGAAGGSRRNLDAEPRAVERGHFHGGAERSFRNAQWYIQDDVVAFAT